MTVEYVVLGAILVVMGAVQIWLRYGPWAKEQMEAERAAAKRRAEKAKAAAQEEAGGRRASAAEEAAGQAVVMGRGSKLWNKWTAILGPLAIVFGLVLIVLGALEV